MLGDHAPHRKRSGASRARWLLSASRDSVLAVAGLWFALALRFEGRIPVGFARALVWLSPIAFVILFVLATLRGVYRAVPKYTSVGELLRIGEVVSVTCGAMFFIALGGSHGHHIPLSVPIIAAPIIYLTLVLVRLWYRLSPYVRKGRASVADADRILIVGAGDAGEMVARDILRNPVEFVPVGFLDDDPAKWGRRIHGVSVLGPIEALKESVARVRADHVLIAMPSAPPRIVRAVLERTSAAGVKAKILPGIHGLAGSMVTAADVRDVDVADLIGRKPVQMDIHEIAGYLQGRRVLVTGAAGSIGSELARQVLRFSPATLVLLDNNETELFYLDHELAGAPGTDVVPALANIRDPGRLAQIFAEHRPQVIFHAAAYKHVSLAELHPAEVVITNVAGTRNVVNAALRHGCERFILVSTDKAVNPTNVMGATKRVAEMLVTAAGADSSTIFSAVRFGNVLGSRGSVVPIFVRQIKRGGPITVTDPEATRYFMTIEEAASLIIQAGALARTGDTFVLDMGEPVRIYDLAERMRDLLANGRGDAVEIVLTGLRPGEKMHEELWHAQESLLSTGHAKILRLGAGTTGVSDSSALVRAVENMECLARAHVDPLAIRELLFSLCTSRPEPGTVRLDPYPSEPATVGELQAR